MVISLYLLILRILFIQSLEDRPLFLLGVIMVIFGAQFFTIGLVGEMITRFQHETVKSKPYNVETRINFEPWQSNSLTTDNQEE